MGAKYEALPRLQGEFTIKKERFPDVNVPWHVHPEYELSFVCMQGGSKHVGSFFGQMKNEEVLLIGPFLPHSWQRAYSDSEFSGGGYQICIHFNEDIYGVGFFNLPPFLKIRELFRQAEYGLVFVENDAAHIKKVMTDMIEMNTFERSVAFLELLNYMASSESMAKLSIYGYRNTDNEETAVRLNKVFKYISDNYRKQIMLADLAEVASMTPPAFCLYFKQKTGKSPKDFINDIRISHACKMLYSEDYDNLRICYDSGFNCISNFHKQFKKVTGMAPNAFRKYIRENIAGARLESESADSEE